MHINGPRPVQGIVSESADPADPGNLMRYKAGKIKDEGMNVH